MDEKALVEWLGKGSVQLIIKPNAKKTEISGFSQEKNAFLISIAEVPEDNKANVELIRFLSKIAKRPVKILLGLTSKRKVVKFA